MMKKTLLTLIVVLTPLVLTQAAPALATPGRSPQFSVEPELVAAYARATGIRPELVQDRIELESKVSDLLKDMNYSPQNTDMDVWLDSSADRPVLHVRSESVDSKEIAQKAKLEGVQTVIHNESPITKWLWEKVDSAEKNLLAAIPGIEGIYIDAENGKAVLNINQLIQKGKTAQQLKDTAADMLGIPVEIKLVEESKDTSAINGGVRMSNCTAGFTAIYKSGNTAKQGLISAAHCPKTTHYSETPSETPPTKNKTTQLVVRHDSRADIAFYPVTTNDTVSKKTYGSSASTPTTQESPLCIAPGATVCFRGKESGYKCGKISSIGYKPVYSDACPGTTCSASFLDINVGIKPGDSGGPVFVNNGSSLQPIGIIKGGNSSHTIASSLIFLPSGVMIK